MKNSLVAIVSIVVICSFLPSFSRAQSSGCLIASTGTVYTTPDDVGLVNALLIAIFGGVKAYKSTPTTASVSACVSLKQTVWVAGTSPCRVCPSGYNVLNLITGCRSSSLEGFVAAPQIINCNLDEYSWSLGTAAGIFGLIIIRRKNLLK